MGWFHASLMTTKTEFETSAEKTMCLSDKIPALLSQIHQDRKTTTNQTCTFSPASGPAPWHSNIHNSTSSFLPWFPHKETWWYCPGGNDGVSQPTPTPGPGCCGMRVTCCLIRPVHDHCRWAGKGEIESFLMHVLYLYYWDLKECIKNF